MHCLAVPDKYKQMGDFHRYYSGQRRAPILTLMIGGNHEASNYLWELYYGGWVAPNMYFMGAAGCVEVGGLSIAGISGIYKSHDFTLGRHERMPYNAGSVRSAYHTRCFDTFRLHLLNRTPNNYPPAIVLSHDWPNTIEQHGDVRWLMQKKSFFKDEIRSECLGSPPLMDLLRDLRPQYWLSAHLHVRFAALVKHDGQSTRIKGRADRARQANESQPDANTKSDFPRNGIEDEIKAESLLKATGEANPDEINIDGDDDFDDEVLPTGPRQASMPAQEVLSTAKERKETRFLALSKCLEGQDFLQILDIPAPFDDGPHFRSQVAHGEGPVEEQPSLRFSPAWLSILRATQSLLSLDRMQTPLPSLHDTDLLGCLQNERDWVQSSLLAVADADNVDHHPLDVRRVQTFAKTALASTDPESTAFGPPPWYTNPQTVALCEYIGIPNRINPPPTIISNAVNTAYNGPSGPRLPQLRAPVFSEEEEIRRIEEAAQIAMERRKDGSSLVVEPQKVEPEEILVTLEDDDEEAARWKEGTG